MSAQPTLITVTSMLFVKIPWALIRVYVKLDIQEMENNVVVRTVSRKYRKETIGHFKFPPFFFSVVWAQNYPVPMLPKCLY